MNLTAVKTIAKTGWKWVCKHSPTILTVMGCGGVVTSVGLAIKATPRAQKKIEKKKEELGVEKLPVKEVIKTCWKDYSLTGGMVLATMSCFVGANLISVKQQAAIAGLYSLAEQGIISRDKELAVIKDEMTKNLGEEKSAEIQEKAKKESQGKPISSIKGSKVYTWKFAGQLFDASPYKILKWENELNRKMWGEFEMCLSLNDILRHMDLDTNEIFGEDTGINRDDGLEFCFGSLTFNEEGESYLPLYLEVPPHKNYKIS